MMGPVLSVHFFIQFYECFGYKIYNSYIHYETHIIQLH